MDNNIDFSQKTLVYRDLLTIPENISFGLELELESVSLKEVSYQIKEQFGSNWRVMEDMSLTKDSNAEIVTPPLYNKKETWQLLKQLSILIKNLNPTYENCSLQVNFNGSLLPTKKNRIKFLKLYATYEDIIYRLSKGEDKALRNNIEVYAHPIIMLMKDGKGIYEYIIESLTNNKKHGITFKNNIANLIEFRTPNGTSNPVLWQNYITTFYYLIMYSKSSKCKETELNQYIENFYKWYLLEYYDQLREKKACELSKKLFNNPVDQNYFIHQYKGYK